MNVCQWAETKWRLPNGELIKLRPWQRPVLKAMFPADGFPSPWETFLISTVKKAGKTTLDAIATLYAVLRFPAPETAFVVANDEAQAQERVFDLIADAVRGMGLETEGAAQITASKIVFPETGSKILAIPADFAGTAGAVFGITSWTELWAFRYEDHIRLWEELTPIPNRRSLRIVDSYAGFSGDAPVLEPMWQRALKGKRLDDELPIYANGKLWAYIDQGEEAQKRSWLGKPHEMESYYAEQRESLRPGTFNRLHRNQWQSGEEAFVTAEQWDACTNRRFKRALDRTEIPQRLYLGIDGATKQDSAAVMAVARVDDRVRLVTDRIWTPRKGDPLDLEETVERFVLHLKDRFRLAGVWFDPYQLARSAKTLQKAGVRVHEFPQTSGNLTAAGQTLYEMIATQRLVVYPDKEIRSHILNAVAIEGSRGWRLAKEKSSRRIDAAAALSFAVLAAVEHGARAAPDDQLLEAVSETNQALVGASHWR